MNSLYPTKTCIHVSPYDSIESRDERALIGDSNLVAFTTYIMPDKGHFIHCTRDKVGGGQLKKTMTIPLA